MKKGIELPVNVLVIVAIAVIVLLGMVALFMGGFSPFTGGVSAQSAFNTGCQELVRGGCAGSCTNINVSFDANKDGTIRGVGDNLYNLTANYFGCPGTYGSIEICCKAKCGCAVG